MEIYNKGKRDFIIARTDFLSKNLKEATDAVGKKYAHIEPEMICEVSDAIAERLIKQYPGVIVQWGRAAKKKR